MSRKNNKKNNSSTSVDAVFLKRDSDVGLFMLEGQEKTKVRIHKDNIKTPLYSIDKWDKFSMPKSLIQDAFPNARRVISCDDSPSATETKSGNLKYFETEEEHKYAQSTQEITTSHLSEFYHLAIGTKYYWLSPRCIPELDDIVLLKDRHGATVVVSVRKIDKEDEVRLFCKVLMRNGEKSKEGTFLWVDNSTCLFRIVSPEWYLENIY